MKYANSKGQRLQEDVIAGLLANKKVSEIASELGVTENSIRNWMQDETFKQKFTAIKAATFDKAMDSVQARLQEGVESMWRLALNEDCSATARVAAFRVLMDVARWSKDLSDIEDRLSKLEGAA